MSTQGKRQPTSARCDGKGRTRCCTTGRQSSGSTSPNTEGVSPMAMACTCSFSRPEPQLGPAARHPRPTPRTRWHAQNWIRSLERYAFPRIGRRPVSEVNTADVLEILTPIWHSKAATAREVRQRIRSVLEWAIAMDLRNDNPCDRVVPVVSPQNDIVTHRLALPHQDVAAAIETVRTSDAAAVKLPALASGREALAGPALPRAGRLRCRPAVSSRSRTTSKRPVAQSCSRLAVHRPVRALMPVVHPASRPADSSPAPAPRRRCVYTSRRPSSIDTIRSGTEAIPGQRPRPSRGRTRRA